MPAQHLPEPQRLITCHVELLPTHSVTSQALSIHVLTLTHSHQTQSKAMSIQHKPCQLRQVKSLRADSEEGQRACHHGQHAP
eukprot:1386595-Amphidinium_carterae.2